MAWREPDELRCEPCEGALGLAGLREPRLVQQLEDLVPVAGIAGSPFTAPQGTLDLIAERREPLAFLEGQRLGGTPAWARSKPSTSTTWLSGWVETTSSQRSTMSSQNERGPGSGPARSSWAIRIDTGKLPRSAKPSTSLHVTRAGCSASKANAWTTSSDDAARSAERNAVGGLLHAASRPTIAVCVSGDARGSPSSTCARTQSGASTRRCSIAALRTGSAGSCATRSISTS